MLVTSKRPRDLKWFHAGPLLFGDWGTSRLYVLGLAFYATAHEAPFYLIAISVLMAAVAWAYTHVCRCFPEGGGVYSAARVLHPTLAVIGTTLLLCGYIMTAAISIVEALHYAGVPDGMPILAGSLVLIAGLGVVNWLGARSAGVFALVIAVTALIVTVVLGAMALRYVPEGIRHAYVEKDIGLWPRWEAFTHIVLALAGVEAVANMTGLMKEPVSRTAKRTIWPVLIEVVIFNLIFAFAMSGIIASMPAVNEVVGPLKRIDLETASPERVAAIESIKNTGMEVIANRIGVDYLGEGVGRWFGKGAAIIFALLLLSAANTAIMAMVSVLFSMAHDRELPRPLLKLNYPGVPWIALVISCVICAMVVVVEQRPVMLAKLYVLGVVGAIAVTVSSCAFNKSLPLPRRVRVLMWGLAGFMAAVTLTIAVTTWEATAFVGTTIAVVLTARFFVKAHQRRMGAVEAGVAAEMPQLETLLTELKREPLEMKPGQPRIMLAARGRYQAEFAVDLARRRGGALFAIYVRTFRLLDTPPGVIPRVEDDEEAIESLGTTAMIARQYRIPFVPIYVASTNIVDEILDYTVTFGCDTLILGKTRRKAFARAIEGDVVTQIAQHLPGDVILVTRDATPHPMPEPPEAPAQPARASKSDGGAADASANGQTTTGERASNQDRE